MIRSWGVVSMKNPDDPNDKSNSKLDKKKPPSRNKSKVRYEMDISKVSSSKRSTAASTMPLGLDVEEAVVPFDDEETNNSNINIHKNNNKNFKDNHFNSQSTNSNDDFNTNANGNNNKNNSLNSEAASSVASTSNTRLFFIHNSRLWLITLVIFVLGSGTSAAFLWIGIASATSEQGNQFHRNAVDLTNKIQRAWEDYVYAASWLHGRCRGRNFTRLEFREMYEYLKSGGLDFQAAQFDPNITHEKRPAAEAEALKFYRDNNYTKAANNYRGFIGFNSDTSTSLEPRTPAPFYFPIHYMEPVVGNEAAIDLDYHASGSRKQTVLSCMNSGQPALTDRLVLVQETEVSAFGVVLMHPGVNLTTQRDIWPRDLASIVIRIPDLLQRASAQQGEEARIFLYDQGWSGQPPVPDPVFLGAVEIRLVQTNNDVDTSTRTQLASLTFLPEISVADLRHNRPKLYEESIVFAANKQWLVAVAAIPGTFEPNLSFIIAGGCIIFVASLCLALWVFTNTQHVMKLNRMRLEADAEKAALILKNAQQATVAERELNDFIAHEVRNPVSAAMAACSFVKAAVEAPEPLQTEKTRSEVREDVGIIDNALSFVNDLLRTMLDLHRAANKQLMLHFAQTDVLHDVLRPVEAMLRQRSSRFVFLVECPENLVVSSDRLRLKQVVLNLGRNSAKFVDAGFIRLRGWVNPEAGGSVEIHVEDSGPGIPEEKRNTLFREFQESLDLLSQGTGIGLFLCKKLVDLMGGEIFLDESYNSGIEGCPGTRFVIRLHQTPLDVCVLQTDESTAKFDGADAAAARGATAQSPDGTTTSSTKTMALSGTPIEPLPENLRVLFVDDDPILRKLFKRTAQTVAPDWVFSEASNGETALLLLETEHYDLIFVDMYMASVQKQLLGTETVAKMRHMGIDSCICGLSANDKEKEFLKAGADAFTFKPFPCERRALINELRRVLMAPQELSNHRKCVQPQQLQYKHSNSNSNSDPQPQYSSGQCSVSSTHSTTE